MMNDYMNDMDSFPPEDTGEGNDDKREYVPDTRSFDERYKKEFEEYRSSSYTADGSGGIDYDAYDKDESEIVLLHTKRKHKKKHLLRKTVIVLILLGCAFGFLMSPYFSLKTISVEGNTVISDEEAIKKAGIKKGDNIFRIRSSKVEEKLLKNPYISSVEMDRTLPGTILLKVEEREEAACVPYGDSFAVIDNSGIVLRKTDRAPELTRLEDMTIKSMDIGETLEVNEKDSLDQVLGLLGNMETADLFFKSIGISESEVTAYVYDNLVIKGSPADITAQVENGNIKTILEDLEKKGTSKGTITVSDSDYIVYSKEVGK